MRSPKKRSAAAAGSLASASAGRAAAWAAGSACCPNNPTASPLRYFAFSLLTFIAAATAMRVARSVSPRPAATSAMVWAAAIWVAVNLVPAKTNGSCAANADPGVQQVVPGALGTTAGGATGIGLVAACADPGIRPTTNAVVAAAHARYLGTRRPSRR
ncbi:hypothetical protein HKD39_04500 [Nakamurella sp. DB0629]|uniref:Uncharacterized protein n=1 Tax=Nakamurella aerolata TaxID=1656892 RepID=A0A849A1S1_9ACTN|nr:hypothetical protein [Nakamurella aerolata]